MIVVVVLVAFATGSFGQVSPPSTSRSTLNLLNMHDRLSQTLLSFVDRESSIATKLRGRALPSCLFRRPAVVEVIGAGFDRPPNEQYLTLRFPRTLKVRSDRIVGEVVDFVRYQRLAESSLEKCKKHAQYASWPGRLDVDNAYDSDQTATPSQTSLSSDLDFGECDDDSKPLVESLSRKRGAADPLNDSFHANKRRQG